MLLLQRNLKVLSDMGLSAKQERTSRFQQIKKEISEMVKVRVPLIKSKVSASIFLFLLLCTSDGKRIDQGNL